MSLCFRAAPPKLPLGDETARRFAHRDHSLDIRRGEQLRRMPIIPILKWTNKGLITMNDRRFTQEGENHSEPEIIPPGQTDFREMESRWGKVSTDEKSFHHIYISRIGPFGTLPFFLLGGLLAAGLVVFAVSAFLILLPVAGVVLAAALVTALLRGRSRWPR
jgi:hypothetical protein